MVVKISKEIPAKEKLRLGNLFYKALKENVQSMLFIVFSFITLLFVIVVTWCAFTINTQNRKQIEIERKIELDMVYRNKMTNEFNNLKIEYQKYKGEK